MIWFTLSLLLCCHIAHSSGTAITQQTTKSLTSRHEWIQDLIEFFHSVPLRMEDSVEQVVLKKRGGQSCLQRLIAVTKKHSKSNMFALDMTQGKGHRSGQRWMTMG